MQTNIDYKRSPVNNPCDVGDGAVKKIAKYRFDCSNKSERYINGIEQYYYDDDDNDDDTTGIHTYARVLRY